MIWRTMTASLLFIAACLTFILLLNIHEATYLNLSIVVAVYVLVTVVPFVVELFATRNSVGRHIHRN